VKYRIYKHHVLYIWVALLIAELIDADKLLQYKSGPGTYDTIEEFNVDWKAEYSALSSTRSQKKKLKQPTT